MWVSSWQLCWTLNNDELHSSNLSLLCSSRHQNVSPPPIGASLTLDKALGFMSTKIVIVKIWIQCCQHCHSFCHHSAYKNYLYNRPWRPVGLWDVEAPSYLRQSTQRSAVRSSALRFCLSSPRRKIPGTHFCWRLSLELNLRPSGVWHRASTNYTTGCPFGSASSFYRMHD
jgi:hypothetical protein